MSSVVSRLVAKDIYLNRWLIAAALVVGLASLGIASSSRMGFNIGGIFYLTTIIAYGIMLVMYGITQERKEKSLLFVLSLPLSGAQYMQSKVLASLGIFLVPWTLLTLGGAAMIAVTRVPDGLIPYFGLVSVFMLMNFCVVLSASLITTSEPVMGAVIILTNLSVSLFFLMLSNIPVIARGAGLDVIQWNEPSSLILAGEIAIALFALALPFIVRRKRHSLI